MELLYRMPTSLHCSQKRSHSPTPSLPRQIFKKKKCAHELPHCPQQPKEDVPIRPSRNDVVKINDMDAFLADGEGPGDYGDCTVLHGNKDHEILDVKLKDGRTLPMERRTGESRLRIPNFVLNTNNSEQPESSRALIRYQPPAQFALEGTRQQDSSDNEGMEVDVADHDASRIDAMEID